MYSCCCIYIRTHFIPTEPSILSLTSRTDAYVPEQTCVVSGRRSAARRSSGALAGKEGIYVCAAVGHSDETTAARYKFADPSVFASFEDYSIAV